MDSRLKQRLIGAFVIVVLAVIFVPYLLKQPTSPNSPVANTTIPPPPVQPQQGERDLTISLESDSAPTEEPMVAEPIVAEPGAAPFSPEPADVTTDPPPIATGPEPESSLPVEAESTLPMIEEPVSTEQVPSLAPRPTVKPVDVTKPTAVPAPPKPTATPRPAPKTATAKPPAPPKTAVAKPPKPTPPKAPKPPPAPAKTAKAPPPAQVALPKVQLIGRSSKPPPQQPANTQVAKAAPSVDLIAQPRASGSRARPAGSGRWIVQVGSFSLQQNANNLRNRLRQSNFSAFVEPVRVSGQTMYRVRVGPQSSRAASEQVLTRLRQAGVSSGQVVTLR